MPPWTNTAAFAAIYDDWASHMTEDVPFYRGGRFREADGPVVEDSRSETDESRCRSRRRPAEKIIGIDELAGDARAG